MRLLILVVVAGLFAAPVFGGQKLLIHEWGTFTSLQDERGNAVGGINADDEALPPFTHDLISDQFRLSQGMPSSFPSVTMRLETPVLYFHPAADQRFSSIDVSATFHGGLLTQFYPAASTAPAIPFGSWEFREPLTARTVSTLTWTGLTLGGDRALPQTDYHVWTTPRAVDAANVTATNGETDRFLFYRGLAHLNAPVRLVRQGDDIEFENQLELEGHERDTFTIPTAWFCTIRADGACAWRSVDLHGLYQVRAGSTLTAADFPARDFAGGNLETLKSDMHAALVKEGLFEDEATAMLATWELSYFKSPGTRLFFIVPRAWTEHYLPLHVLVEADIRRVMVGRVDIVTPEQRRILKELAATDAVKQGDRYKQLYDSLGRFRSALVRLPG